MHSKHQDTDKKDGDNMDNEERRPIGLFDDIPDDIPENNIQNNDPEPDPQIIISNEQETEIEIPVSEINTDVNNTDTTLTNENISDISEISEETQTETTSEEKPKRKRKAKVSNLNLDELFEKVKKKPNGKNIDNLMISLYDTMKNEDPEYESVIEYVILKKHKADAIRTTMALFFQNNMKYKTTLHYNSLSENDKIDMYKLVIDELENNPNDYDDLPLEIAIDKALQMLMTNHEWKKRLGYYNE